MQKSTTPAIRSSSRQTPKSAPWQCWTFSSPSWSSAASPLKSLDSGKPYASGKETRIECSIKEGIAQDQAKKISKMIREEGPKGVKANIQGDELRVSSKSRDDLQEVIAMLKSADLEIDLQFVNYR